MKPNTIKIIKEKSPELLQSKIQAALDENYVMTSPILQIEQRELDGSGVVEFPVKYLMATMFKWSDNK